MERQKKVLLSFLFVASLVSAANFGFAIEKEYEATNCTYTGNSSDYCNASSGTQNVKVLNCRPGSTDCSYSLP